MRRLIRLLFMFRLFFLEGTKRASYLKNNRYFKSQGEFCYFAIYNFGTEPELLSFGENVVIATGVRLITHDMSAWMVSRAEFNDPYRIKINKPISFGDNVFVGADCRILPGVSVGDNVIIGAGSVVTKDLESGFVYAGVPAKKITTYTAYINRLMSNND
jgi:acetyltransferase-like isoleucine patch superfamily enzyme